MPYAAPDFAEAGSIGAVTEDSAFSPRVKFPRIRINEAQSRARQKAIIIKKPIMVARAFCCRDAVLGTECFIVDGSFPVSAIIPHFKEKSNRGKAFLNKYIYKVILKNVKE